MGSNSPVQPSKIAVDTCPAGPPQSITSFQGLASLPMVSCAHVGFTPTTTPQRGRMNLGSQVKASCRGVPRLYAGTGDSLAYWYPRSTCLQARKRDHLKMQSMNTRCCEAKRERTRGDGAGWEGLPILQVHHMH